MCILVLVHNAMLMYLRHARKTRTDERPFFRTDVWGCRSVSRIDGCAACCVRTYLRRRVDTVVMNEGIERAATR